MIPRFVVRKEHPDYTCVLHAPEGLDFSCNLLQYFLCSPRIDLL